MPAFRLIMLKTNVKKRFIVFVIGLVSLTIFGVATAKAQSISATLQYAGYAGENSVGVGYHFNNRHAIHTHIGLSKTDSNREIWQATSKYVYSPHKYDLNSQTQWKWLYSGILATFTNHSLFFEEVADRYPTRNWYDPTSLRLGLLVGSQLDVKVAQSDRMSFYLELVTLETQLIAFVNNPKHFNGEDLFSAGLGIRYFW